MSEEAPACRSNPGAMTRATAYIKDVQVGHLFSFLVLELWA
jgi:hypothetical protein